MRDTYYMSQTMNSDIREHSRHFLDRVLLAIPDIVYVYDLHEQRNIFVNHEVTAILGYTPEEIAALGSDLFDVIVHPDDLALVRQALADKRHLADGETSETEYQMRHVDGTYRWLYSRETVFARDEYGVVTQLLGIAHDVTEEKRIRQELEQSRQFYNELVESLPAMVYRYRCSSDGELQGFDYVSPRSLELNGIEPGTVIANPMVLVEQFLPEDKRTFIQTADRAHQSLNRLLYEGRASVDGKLCWRRIEAHPRRMDDGSIVWFGIQTDTTEQHRLQESDLERRRLQMEFDKEHELRVLKGKMMTRINHEFRTPLAVVMTSCDLIERYDERMSAAQRASHLLTIRDQVRQITRMLDDMALTVKGLSGVLQPSLVWFDLIALCQQVIGKLRHSPFLITQIEFSSDCETCMVQADQNLIGVMLAHLLSNAVKYTHQDDTVRVYIKAKQRPIEIDVIDRGIGISPREYGLIFEPFYRGSNIDEVGGLGVGLTLALYIAGLHGGGVSVNSQVGHGSAFTVRLPVEVSA
jgi:PAS domain S-box-containing protein